MTILDHSSAVSGGERHRPGRCRGTFVARLGAFRRDDRGAIMIMFALVLPVMIGFAGLGVEVGFWYMSQRSLQTIADAAAITGGFEIRAGKNSATMTQSAKAAANQNGFDQPGGDTIDVNNPPAAGSFISDPSAVEVALSRTVQLFFSKLFEGAVVTVDARAVAVTLSGGDACVLALDLTAPAALLASGNAQASFDDCMVASNSNAANALAVQGTSSITAECAAVVGDTSAAAPELSLDCGDARTGNPLIQDPYAGLPAPVIGACDQNAFRVNANQTVTVTPGVYCNGFEARSQSTVLFESGVYIIDRGLFKINGGAIIEEVPGGTGVTIILTSSTATAAATVTINGGAIMTLAAPTVGPYAGVLFWQDETTVSGTPNDFLGGATVNLTGALYFPSQLIRFSGGSELGGATCTQIVANKVEFRGNAQVNSNCAGAGTRSISIPGAVALVE